jgi:carbamoyltransferase
VKRDTFILGLNAYHGDSSACLLRDGKILAAVEEERLLRSKHWAGFPEQSIRYCLAEAGAKFSDINAIAVNRDPRQTCSFFSARWLGMPSSGTG